MSILVTGSLAYDHIMVFRDHFKNHILPEKTHILSVTFTTDNLRKEFGGTAGNIAYNLALLGEKPQLFATAGKDFSSYAKWLRKNKISTNGIRIIPSEFTAQAFITTDLSDNQITAFHGGAMLHAHKYGMKTLKKKPQIAIISPNAIGAMVAHAKFCQKKKISFIFDPGQGITSFSKDELIQSARGARILIMNDYEWELWKEKTKLGEEPTLKLVENIIVTFGENGSRLINMHGEKHVAAYMGGKPTIDPTGCGDAYRAGLLHGLNQHFSIEESMKIGTTLASFCREKHGTQNHTITKKSFAQR